MSTRAQVIVKDGYEEVWFYRHSDGYPEGVLPTIQVFTDWVKQGLIRDNAEQAAGWLVILGHREYAPERYNGQPVYTPEPSGGVFGWKVGAYEPCSAERHGDIEYLYTIDLKNREVLCEDIYAKKTKTILKF